MRGRMSHRLHRPSARSAAKGDTRKVLYDECGGFVDCTADAAKIWAAFRKLAQGVTVEDDSDD